MAWKIELTRESKKQLGKLDRANAKRIRDYLRRQVEPASDPRGLAKPLKGRFAMLWRLRVGSYHLICDIRDNDRVILVNGRGRERFLSDSGLVAPWRAHFLAF